MCYWGLQETELISNGLEVLLGATGNGIDSKRSGGVTGAIVEGIDSKRSGACTGGYRGRN
jgi:hypothetical protein